MKRHLFFLVMLLLAGSMNAQLSAYFYSSTAGSYNEISGGTVLGTATTNDERFVDPANPLGGSSYMGVGYPIGFDFTFDGIVFDRFAVNANGWISLGQSSLTPSVNNRSTGPADANYHEALAAWPSVTPAYLVSRIAGFACNLQAQSGSEIRIQTVGTSPNQECVIQWKRYKQYASLGIGDNLNFQIRLIEGSNKVKVIFGVMHKNIYGVKGQTGIRGIPLSIPASNFADRTTLTDWVNSTAGTSSYDNLLLSNIVYPPVGLTYTWTEPFPCSGTPNPGNTLVSDNLVCPGESFNLSLQNITEGNGISYQWQCSANGADPWTNFGTLAQTVTTTQAASAYYRCQVSCSGNTGNSVPVFVACHPAWFCNYCPCGSNGNPYVGINGVVASGGINNPDNGKSFYSDFTDMTSTVAQTSTMAVNLYFDDDWYSYYKAYVFLDFNHDGDFNDPGENVGSASDPVYSCIITFPIPQNATPGITRMRIKFGYVGDSDIPMDDGPCQIYSYGETEDYSVNILPATSSISGYVYDYNGDPVAGATVKMENEGATAITGTDGSYLLSPIIFGNIGFRCFKAGFTDVLAAVSVPANGQANHNFTLLQPQMDFNVNSIFAVLDPTESDTYNITITNNGTGVLNWQATVSTVNWLSLDNFSGQVNPFGGTQPLVLTIDATATQPDLLPGTSVSADILFTPSASLVPVIIPVTLTISDPNQQEPEYLVPYFMDEGNGEFMLKWKYFSLRDAQFDHFAIFRNDELISTSEVSSFSFILDEPGTYCYKVCAVYEGNIYSVPSNEVCITYPIAPGVPIANWALLIGGLLMASFVFIRFSRRS